MDPNVSMTIKLPNFVRNPNGKRSCVDDTKIKVVNLARINVSTLMVQLTIETRLSYASRVTVWFSEEL